VIPGHSSISRVSRVGAAGGAGRLWTPADIADLVCWWDADSGVGLTDGKVSSWASKIGTGTFLQTTAANRPTMTIVNGVPALLLNGTNQFMTLPQRDDNPSGFILPDPGATNTNFLMVAAPNALQGHILGINNGNFGMGAVNVSNNPRAGSRYGGAEYAASAENWVGTRSLSFEWQLLIYPGIQRGVQNGKPLMSRSPSIPGSSLTNSPAYLGYTGDSGIYWNGTISALAGARTLLSGADQDRWEGYYAHKLGTTAYLSASHPYKSAPPRV
jgi:hypothetical protein